MDCDTLRHPIAGSQPAAGADRLVEYRARTLGANQSARGGCLAGHAPFSVPTGGNARQRGAHGDGRHQRILPDEGGVPLPEPLPARGPRHVRRRGHGSSRARDPRGRPLRPQQDAEGRLRRAPGVVLPEGRRQPGHLQRPLFDLHQRRLLSRAGDEDPGRGLGALRRGRPVLQHVRQPVHRLQRRLCRPVPLRFLPHGVPEVVRPGDPGTRRRRLPQVPADERPARYPKRSAG